MTTILVVVARCMARMDEWFGFSDKSCKESTHYDFEDPESTKKLSQQLNGRISHNLTFVLQGAQQGEYTSHHKLYTN